MKKEEKGNRRTGYGKWVVRGLLALLLAVSLFFYRDSFREIWEGVMQVTAKELCVCILLAGAGYVLEGMTIFCMMGAVMRKPSARDGVFIAFVCEFYRLTTLGNGSGVAEIHYLCQCGKEEKIAPGSATVLTMIQYILKRIAIIGLGIFGFLVLYQRKDTQELCKEYAAFVLTACLITAGIIAVFLALSLSDQVAAGAFWVLEKLSWKLPSRQDIFRKWKEQITLLNRSGKSILRQRGRMLCAVLIQMGKLLLFYGITAYLLYGKASLGAGSSLLLMALSFMLAGVIPTPSGAGALEFVFLLFFTRFADSGTAVIAILLFRFATWICSAAAGGLLLAAEGIRKRPKKTS